MFFGFFSSLPPSTTGKKKKPKNFLMRSSRRWFTHEQKNPKTVWTEDLHRSQGLVQSSLWFVKKRSLLQRVWETSCLAWSFTRIKMHLKYKTFSLQSIFSTTDKSQTCQGGLALSRMRFTLQLKYYCSSLLDFLGFKLISDAWGHCIGGWWFILPSL